MKDRWTRAQALIEAVIGLLTACHEQVASGVFTEAQARARATQEIPGLCYGKGTTSSFPTTGR